MHCIREVEVYYIREDEVWCIVVLLVLHWRSWSVMHCITEVEVYCITDVEVYCIAFEKSKCNALHWRSWRVLYCSITEVYCVVFYVFVSCFEVFCITLKKYPRVLYVVCHGEVYCMLYSRFSCPVLKYVVLLLKRTVLYYCWCVLHRIALKRLKCIVCCMSRWGVS